MSARGIIACWCLGLLVGSNSLPAEQPRLNPDAAKIIGRPNAPAANQQNSQQGQQGQQNPNQIQGQTPPIQQLPAGQQPPAQQSAVPPSAALEDQRSPDRGLGDIPRRESIPDAGIVPDIARESLGLDQLNADEARKQSQFDPARFGRGAGDADTDALVEQLRGLTGGSNRDQQSDTTRGLSGGIVTDPGALLSGAGSGLAGDGAKTEITHNADGSSTRTTTRRDDAGEIIQQDSVTQDSEGNVLSAEDVDVTETGTITHRAQRTSDGDYVHTVTIQRRDGTVNIGPTPWRSPDWVANVDPDSAYGKGGGQVIAPGQKARDPKMVEARDGVGPGARPNEHAGAAVTPRLNVDVDLTGQPNPGEQVGGSGPGYQGYNPDDFVRPPRPNDP